MPNLPRPRGLPISKSLSCEVGERVGCQDKDVYRALCTPPPDFSFCVSVCDGAGESPAP